MSKKKKNKPKPTARTADKHVLYEQSVQAPEDDAKFFARYYKKFTGGGRLRVFREDFCGTSALSCAFVRLHRDNEAIGVDLDRPTLDWARRHNVLALEPEARERVHLVNENVLDVQRPKADLLAALNFSYSVFKTRDEMGRYIQNAYDSLETGGLFVMDAWGGGQVQFQMQERKRQKGFTYVWDQARFDPITNHILCKIHFEFRDGSRMKNAFVYDWRLWMLPELRELMADAGFADIHVLWEGTDRQTGEGNGIFRRVERGGDEEAWIAYVIAQKH